MNNCGFNLITIEIYYLFVYHLKVFLKNIIRTQKVRIVVSDDAV